MHKSKELVVLLSGTGKAARSGQSVDPAVYICIPDIPEALSYEEDFSNPLLNIGSVMVHPPQLRLATGRVTFFLRVFFVRVLRTNANSNAIT